jgi:diguanylate cyclase (GGDEF)-like protein
MLSYFLLTAMTAAFFMPFKQAIWHLLAISVVELYVAFNSANVPNGKIISLNILFFTMMTAAMLMVARKRIQDGILHNVALAGRDPLTGVANLRKFNERLQTEIDRADRSGEPLTLLMIDLDDFKDVNDKYSYTLGDAVLVASARAMSRVVRSNELLARRGGDEFAVIAVGADSESAEALSKRIKHAVRRERLKLCPDVSPEASVGIADWRIGESAVELLRRADSSLHVSKIIAHTEEPYSDM